jgi:nucleoside-diphosphate kinase
MEKTLVLIKPDAMAKGLMGPVISELDSIGLKMIGLKVVNVKKDLAETHYAEHKGKPFFEKLVKHLTGELHGGANVVAMVYKGENAIKRIRETAGETNPEKAHPNSIRGKYGRINSENDCFENVIHSSDSPESAEKEISLWFRKDELLE